jgi:hypothetical protein
MAEILHPGKLSPGSGNAAFTSENLPTLQSPSDPDKSPFNSIPAPPHLSTGLWQQSWYDPTSQEAVSNYQKRPSGPCSLETGKLTGDGFPSHSDGARGFGQV